MQLEDIQRLKRTQSAKQTIQPKIERAVELLHLIQTRLLQHHETLNEIITQPQDSSEQQIDMLIHDYTQIKKHLQI